jgi:hypothetical protein
VSEKTRATLRRGLHLAVLWSFCVGQPLLAKADSSVFFFLPRSAAPFDFVIVGIAVLLVAPAILMGVEALVGTFSERGAEGLHLVLMGILFWLLALQMERFISLRAPVPGLLFGLVVAVAATFAYTRTKFVPTVLDVLGPAPLLFLGLFLFVSPIAPLWLPGGEPEAADVTPQTTPPVVVIIMDEFPGLSLQDRPGHIDESLFPNFARLAARSTWYPNATSVADSTEAAVPAILTGIRPDHDRDELAIASNFPHSIFTLLGNSYDIDAVETETQICPRSICDRAVRDPFFPRVPRILGDLAQLTPAAVLPKHIHRELYGEGAGVSPLPPKSPPQLYDIFDEHINGDQAHMSLIHSSNLPHKPWNLVPSKQHYAIPATDGALSQSRALTASASARVIERKRHLLQVGAADSILGDAIDRLKQEGIWDKAVVVVVADHGISFRPLLPRRKAVPNNLDQVGFVPFFVKAPGQTTGKIDPAAAETIDVVPTIAKMIGLPIPWHVDGLPAGERKTGDVEMTDFKRRIIESPLTTVEKRAHQFQRQWAGILDYGHGWDALIRSGPGSELIGEKVPADLAKADGTATVPQIPAEGSEVLAVVDGSLSGVVPKNQQIAIAVNGRVEAATTAIQTSTGLRYEAILPPSVYEKPINSLQVLEISPGGSPRLLGERTAS